MRFWFKTDFLAPAHTCKNGVIGVFGQKLANMYDGFVMRLVKLEAEQITMLARL